jgi:hypothetical protein
MSITEIMENKMLKFLQQYYPISRIKVKTQLQQKNCFKRGLYIDGEPYLLSDKTNMFMVVTKLIKKLQIVFNYDEKVCKNVLKRFL